MAAPRKFEGLPDIDATAPDVYETPELTDGLSTIQETSAHSPSVDTTDTSEAGDEDERQIDKRRWKADQARSRFRPSRVAAEGVDFSDRLNVRKSYRIHDGRRRDYYEDEPDAFGDSSDDDTESLDRKLARLRKEVEQIQAALAEKDDAENSDSESIEEEDPVEAVEKISNALDQIHAKRRGLARGAEADFASATKAFAKSRPRPNASRLEEHSRPSPVADVAELTQALSKAADLDARLAALEKAIGLNGSNLPDSGDDSTKLILPTLQTLEQLIGTAIAHPAQIEPAQLKTKQLIKDAERLSKLRAEDGDESRPQGTSNPSDGIESSEQTSKINALYGILPTIDSLSPSLPLLLERLRTLRLIHTNSAEASALLDDVDKRQDDQEEEIKQWKEALSRVEGQLEEEQETLKENVELISSLVKGLEARLGKSA